MSRIEPSSDRAYQDFLQQVTALVRQSRVGVARSGQQLAYEILQQTVAVLERMLMLDSALLEGEQDG